MAKPDLAALELFVAVARNRSFRKTATERGVSASSVSQAIRNLEERLGTRLLNRTTRSVAPTEAGRLLLERLQPALASVAEALDRLGDLRGTPSGLVRINAPKPAVDFLLAPLIGPFREAFPEVRLEIICDAANVDIVEAGFDAGVRYGEELALDMVALPLGPPLHYVVAGAPAYLARKGTPGEPADLLQHDCIRIRFPSGTIFEWSFEKDGREVTFAPEGPVTLNDPWVAVQAAIGGAGLVRVADSYLTEGLAAGTLVEVLADWSPTIPSWYLYYPGRRHMPAAFRAFLDFAKRHSSAARTQRGDGKD